jgi:predicted acylesterase/phospholipase RssA
MARLDRARPALMFSLAGLAAGYVLGGLLAENGYVPSWILGTLAGAVAGSFAALTLLNLFASGS